MARRKVACQMIGVRLLPESYIPHCDNTHQLDKGQIIGTVYIPIEGTLCTYLRHAIKESLNAPNDFCFLNSAGWPFDSTLESKIPVIDCLLSNVVTIQKKHGKLSRVGVALFNGEVLGFILLNFSSTLLDIRQSISSTLGDLFENNETFEFLENNLWPVRNSQEVNLSAWDIVVNNCIRITKRKYRTAEGDEERPNKRLKLRKKSSVENINQVEKYENPHSIFISYVHHEADMHAKALKKELLTLGFKKIFLDYDDIPAGKDWTDVISLAVKDCSVFIPLVTSRYGETQWTNREAKLADDREKLIIPISFLDTWPPDQLAIQFVTLQYIPWKTSDEIKGGNFSGLVDTAWSQKSLQRVANEIKKLCSQPEVSTPDSASLLDSNPEPSRFSLKISEKQRIKLNGKKQKDFIVISAHSMQQDFVNKIIGMLKCLGYEVWTSLKMCDCDEDSFSPLEDTQFLNSPLIENNGSFPSYDEKGSMEHSSNSVKNLKRDFKAQVKEAKLVVLIFSEEYTKSRICRQQLYYCQERKKVIVIKHGDFQMDSMILNLYPEHEMIAAKDIECLKFKIQEKLKFDTEDSYRSNIMLSVCKLKNAVNIDKTVYVIGGTDSISSSAQRFCLILGNELAKVNNLCLATEGFYGAGDLVGKNFCEEQEIRNKGQAPNVYHIVPLKDESDYSHKAKQQPFGSFEKLPYGNTLFYGISVANRDDIVAAAFKLCILIEGGGRSACLAEKFLWNDCTVIPVLFNNVIKNKQCLLESITKVPVGVNEDDWRNLNRQNCSPEDRAKSVKRIVCSLLNLNT